MFVVRSVSHRCSGMANLTCLGGAPSVARRNAARGLQGLPGRGVLQGRVVFCQGFRPMALARVCGASTLMSPDQALDRLRLADGRCRVWPMAPEDRDLLGCYARTAATRRRRRLAPASPKPVIIRAQVAGSGTPPRVAATTSPQY